MAEAEDSCKSVAVGGLAHDLGMPIPFEENHTHYCTECGSVVKMGDGSRITRKDYIYWCTNSSCIHHGGEGFFDDENPGWVRTEHEKQKR